MGLNRGGNYAEIEAGYDEFIATICEEPEALRTYVTPDDYGLYHPKLNSPIQAEPVDRAAGVIQGEPVDRAEPRTNITNGGENPVNGTKFGDTAHKGIEDLFPDSRRFIANVLSGVLDSRRFYRNEKPEEIQNLLSQ